MIEINLTIDVLAEAEDIIDLVNAPPEWSELRPFAGNTACHSDFFFQRPHYRAAPANAACQTQGNRPESRPFS